MPKPHRRAALGAVLAGAVAPLLPRPSAAAPPANAEYVGKVVPLAGQLEKAGARLDADAAPYWLALVGKDDKTYLLVKDDGSRMFFVDKRLLDRPMRLTGRLVANSSLLQVVDVHSFVGGKLHEVYYWCDICAIRRRESKLCDCCNAPLELREEPAK